ncbi:MULTISPECIES: helix-turn-helix domain-containing protein [unclassified Clostridium]|uniref:helix-turn-helix domain-containing protein n=1 Tax=unclassified Clostridium TaxID=2614128 RepID=UPI002910D5AE|nr:helix-turn-helix domain-containing protein [Clostridium sp.]MDU5108468.1 helix-turn-helix domain-containing protein [Clostridium sp.]
MSRQRSIEKILKSEYITIGELVRITNSRYSTLKFYTEEAILPFEQEDEGLTRRFKREASIKRIEEIKELKKQGYRVDEIKELLIEVNKK